MKAWLLLCLLAAVPYWENKEVPQWDEEELESFLGDSPWARPAEAVGMRGRGASSTRTFLATATPVRLAEREWRQRRIPRETREADEAWREWEEFLAKDGEKVVVLAVAIPPQFAADAKEMAEMENQSVLRAGKRKWKLSGYFPATASDPFTRLIFPRPPGEFKEMVFELYAPGDVGGNFREAIYVAKEMSWKGRLSF